MPTAGIPKTIESFLIWACKVLATEFRGDRTQTMWEGHMQYRLCQILLDEGYLLEFGEPGGDNKQGCRLRRPSAPEARGSMTLAARTSRTEARGITRDSSDIVVCGHGQITLEWRLQLKTFPETGNKRGVATFKGFEKDFNYVKSHERQRAAFIFVADGESYDGLRGIRRAAQGPKESRRFYPLPVIPSPGATLFAEVEDCQGYFERVLSTADNITRVVGALWRK